MTAVECLSLDFRKLLIPEEVFKSGQQKRYEIQNFKNANISPREWRIKKCYRNVSFEIFWKSKLCPGDIHTCVHSYAVEELQLFKNYRDYLLQISELCADGYVLDKQDRDFFKKSTQGEVDRFSDHVKQSRRKIVDYNNLKDSGPVSKDPKVDYEKEKEFENTNFEKLKLERNNKNDLEDEEKKIFEEEKKLKIRKQLLEEEKRILQQKKKLEDLKKSIEEAESLIKKKKNDIKE